MSTDTEIVDWMEKNAHRLMMHRGRYGVIRFSWAIRSDTGQYHWHDDRPTLRQAVSEAIAHDQQPAPVS
jgi:hypothetical protein